MLGLGLAILASIAGARTEHLVALGVDLLSARNGGYHVAFGIGKHRCIGSTLARAEFATMLATTLRRIPDFRIDRDATVRYPSLGIVNGYVSMPATFTVHSD